jgi:hypothetical protein
MKFITNFILITILSITFSNAQMILNAESLRVSMLKGKENWAGNAGVSFSFIKNTNEIFIVNTNVAVGYNGGENLWMIISNLNFNKIDGDAFQNSGVQHFRFNRELNKRMAFEAYLQGQYDKISNVDFRGLAGLGLRFELTNHDKKIETNETARKQKSRVYLGSSIMYEYEKSTEAEANIIQRDIRSSNYISFTIFPTKQFTIVSTTYYQPKIDLLKDYRLSSVIDLNIGFSSKDEEDEKSFWDKLTFNMSFSYNYDAFPVIAIPKTQYSLTNGLRFSF